MVTSSSSLSADTAQVTGSAAVASPSQDTPDHHSSSASFSDAPEDPRSGVNNGVTSTTPFIAATTTVTVTIIVIVLVLAVVRKRRRRRRRSIHHRMRAMMSIRQRVRTTGRMIFRLLDFDDDVD